MKTCSKCKVDKELVEFSQWTNKRSGKVLISSRCKTCVTNYAKARYVVKRDEIRAYMKERYAQNREQAIEKARAYYEANKDKVKLSQRKYYDNNRSTILVRMEEWKRANPEKFKAAQDRWTRTHREQVRASANKYARANVAKAAERWKTMRLMVMEAYGGAFCSCCCESTYEFLTMDHVDNDGAEHRAAIGKHLYRWLIEHDYPEGFQVLCMNCNFGKHRNGGVCPHKDHESSSTRAEARTLQAIGSGSARRPS